MRGPKPWVKPAQAFWHAARCRSSARNPRSPEAGDGLPLEHGNGNALRKSYRSEGPDLNRGPTAYESPLNCRHVGSRRTARSRRGVRIRGGHRGPRGRRDGVVAVGGGAFYPPSHPSRVTPASRRMRARRSTPGRAVSGSVPRALANAEEQPVFERIGQLLSARLA
jgi:hypothetical protein